MNINFKTIVDTLDELGYTPRSYSGRGMYGKECLGVVCDNPVEMIIDLTVELLLSTEENSVYTAAEYIREELGHPSQDDMGRQTVVYWPNIPWDN